MAQSPTIKLVRSEPSEFASIFSEFYCKIILKIYDLSCRRFLDDVKEELKNIRRLKYLVDILDQKHPLVDINYEKTAARCAYLYSYCVINTCEVYREFSIHLEEKKIKFPNQFSPKILNVCCLGGGPATEAVGIIKSIHDVIWMKSKKSNSTVEVNITIVDICPDWKCEVSEIVKALNDSKLFLSKEIKFRAEYFEADLLKPFEESLKRVINKAEIVTIVNFLRAVRENSPLDCIPKNEKMMKSVIGCMAQNSCLFMLDTSGGVTFNCAAEVICKYRSDFDAQIHRHKGYRLHPKTLKELENAMNFRNFAENPTLFPTHLRKVSSCFWIRKIIPLN